MKLLQSIKKEAKPQKDQSRYGLGGWKNSSLVFLGTYDRYDLWYCLGNPYYGSGETGGAASVCYRFGTKLYDAGWNPYRAHSRAEKPNGECNDHLRALDMAAHLARERGCL